MRCEWRPEFAYVSVRYIMYSSAYLWPRECRCCCHSLQVQRKIFLTLWAANYKLENVAAGWLAGWMAATAARCIHARNQIVITASTLWQGAAAATATVEAVVKWKYLLHKCNACCCCCCCCVSASVAPSTVNVD